MPLQMKFITKFDFHFTLHLISMVRNRNKSQAVFELQKQSDYKQKLMSQKVKRADPCGLS